MSSAQTENVTLDLSSTCRNERKLFFLSLSLRASAAQCKTSCRRNHLSNSVGLYLFLPIEYESLNYWLNGLQWMSEELRPMRKHLYDENRVTLNVCHRLNCCFSMLMSHLYLSIWIYRLISMKFVLSRPACLTREEERIGVTRRRKGSTRKIWQWMTVDNARCCCCCCLSSVMRVKLM